MARVFIAMGSNVGDREANIRLALSLIDQTGAGRVQMVSTLVDTGPVGGPSNQGEYLNGAALVETDLQPNDLLKALKNIEARVGRVERERWGPREIDLDILLYDGKIVKSPDIEIPHPRMSEREFVLAPLAEIAPDAVHPVTGRTIAELLAALSVEKSAT